MAYLDEAGLEALWGDIESYVGEEAIPDGSITTTKLANGAVTDAKLAQSGGVLEAVENLKSALGNGRIGTFSQSVTSNGWYFLDYPTYEGKKYTFKNTGNTTITANIYGATGKTQVPLYTGSGTSPIAVGNSVTFTAAASSERIRLYLTAGANGFEISEESTALYSRVETLETEVDTLETAETSLQTQINSLNSRQITVEYSPANTELGDGRVRAFTGAIDTTGSVFSYIEIPVSEGDTIIFTPQVTGSCSGYGYALYDSNGDYVTGGAPTVDVETTVTIPANCAYFRYSLNNPIWQNPTYNTFVVVTQETRETLVSIVRKDVAFHDLVNKVWNAVGDSITYQGRYVSRVASITGLTAVNCGIGGSTIAINDSYLTAQSIVERVCGLNGNVPYADADVWTVMGGLNDCMYSSPIGAIASVGSSFDNATVYGALQSICEYILNLRAHPRLVLFTPTQSLRDTWSESQYPTTMKKIRQAIIDVGAVYSIPVYDAWAEGGISSYNIRKSTNPTTSDGVHINDLGGDILSPNLARAIHDTFFGV